MPKRYHLAPQRCENDDDDGNDQPSGEKKNRVLSGEINGSDGEITAARDLEMNCNVFWARCRGGSDVTSHDAGLR